MRSVGSRCQTGPGARSRNQKTTHPSKRQPHPGTWVFPQFALTALQRRKTNGIRRSISTILVVDRTKPEVLLRDPLTEKPPRGSWGLGGRAAMPLSLVRVSVTTTLVLWDSSKSETWPGFEGFRAAPLTSCGPRRRRPKTLLNADAARNVRSWRFSDTGCLDAGEWSVTIGSGPPQPGSSTHRAKPVQNLGPQVSWSGICRGHDF